MLLYIGVLLYLWNSFQIGGTYTKPIILPNQLAIGALGKIQVSTFCIL